MTPNKNGKVTIAYKAKKNEKKMTQSFKYTSYCVQQHSLKNSLVRERRRDFVEMSVCPKGTLFLSDRKTTLSFEKRRYT